MAKAKDLTGNRFGRLTVVALSKDPYVSPTGKKTRKWDCVCDCGNRVIVLTNALTAKNGTRSCGCIRSDVARTHSKDLSGRIFGRLRVVESVDLEKPESNGNRLGWRCICDCGNEIIATNKQLSCQGLKSCGCLLSDTGTKKVVDKNVFRHFDSTTISAIQETRGPNKNNKSGVKGVYWLEREKRWVAKIGVQNRSITIGRYKSLDEAAAARRMAEKEYFEPIIDKYNNRYK